MTSSRQRPRTPVRISARRTSSANDPALSLVAGCGIEPVSRPRGGAGSARPAGKGPAAQGYPAVPASPGGLSPLARLQVEQAREALETLDDRVRGADLATAMLLLGEARKHTQFLLDLVDALTVP